MDPNSVLPPAPVASYSHHLRARAGDAILAASLLGAEATIDVIDEAGLRGRGGAWFPVATKWRTTNRFRSVEAAPSLVVNAAEGEPGSFKDRMLIRRDPYSVVEGAVIAARAVGADTIVIATKESFATEVARLKSAVAEVQALATERIAEVVFVYGPDRYLFGEESALLEVVVGHQPFPRIGPPWRHGALDMDGTGSPASTAMAAPFDEGTLPPPALVHNVETLARVAHVIRYHGADRPEWPVATFLATVSGDVPVAGVEEFPVGTSLRDVVGDGADDAAAVLNGVSYPLIPAGHLDRPMVPQPDAETSLPIGAAAIRVFAKGTHPVAIARAAASFLSVESCGQCLPCKTEGLAIAGHLDAARSGAERLPAVAESLQVSSARVVEGARCGLAGQIQGVVDGLLAFFPDALADPAGVRSGPDPVVAPLVDLVDGRAIIDGAHADVQPDWTTETPWSGRFPATSRDRTFGEDGG
ncbi:MAG: NADH-ubiquinone oxidoreductase-F iron-sulfur binding region domain-containing protein [Acidimicrobiales bacterium]